MFRLRLLVIKREERTNLYLSKEIQSSNMFTGDSYKRTESIGESKKPFLAKFQFFSKEAKS